VRLLLSTHERFADHDTGRGHPERPARLGAVLDGIRAAGVSDALVPTTPRPASRAELELTHPAEFLDAMERFCRAGGGYLDADTFVVPGSWEAAVLAAGAGPDAIGRLDRGEADAAFCVVRPPGHHAEISKAMGFCLINNVAVTANVLAERGERVLIVDWDAHHGNGTQACFYDDPRVLYVSLHEFPLYPFSGRIGDIGVGEGRGTTINLPLPAGLTGDVALAAVDEVVTPAVEAFGPTWLLISAGFDGHRADPLTGLALSSGDFADLTERVLAYVPAGRRIAFLEGGYDLEGLASSAGACAAALVGTSHRPEPSTNGGPGRKVVDAALAAVLTTDRGPF
jgi:acetoin utilization deacetylase AcuC-like enzyme